MYWQFFYHRQPGKFRYTVGEIAKNMIPRTWYINITLSIFNRYSRVSNKRVNMLSFPVLDFPQQLAYQIPPRLSEFVFDSLKCESWIIITSGAPHARMVKKGTTYTRGIIKLRYTSSLGDSWWKICETKPCLFWKSPPWCRCAHDSCTVDSNTKHLNISPWYPWIIPHRVRPWKCSCLVTWFCYQLSAKPGNKIATPPGHDQYCDYLGCISKEHIAIAHCQRYVVILTDLGFQISLWHKYIGLIFHRITMCLNFIFTRGQFWPSGIVVACVCLSMSACLCVR